MNKTQAKRKADALFSRFIRSRGVCQIADWAPQVACNGNLQCCHVRSRRYMSIRWDPVNALCGCAAHHLYFSMHPAEWEQAVDDHHELSWHHLRTMALNNPPQDPFFIVESYKEAS